MHQGVEETWVKPENTNGGLQHWAAIIRTISTSSAVNPALLLVAMCAPVAIFSMFSSPIIQYAGLAIFAAAAAVTAFQIIWFTFIDPPKLQHDKHVEKMAQLRMNAITIRAKGGTKEISIPEDAPLIDNPQRAGDE